MDRCMVERFPREELVWGRKVASFLDPGRRREVDLVPPVRSSDDCELLRWWRGAVDECSLPSGCGRDEANGWPFVSLGFDIADGVDEGGIYLCKSRRGGKDQSLKWGPDAVGLEGGSGDESRSGSTTAGYGLVVMFCKRVADQTWKTGGLGGRGGRLKTMGTRAWVWMLVQKWDHGRSKSSSDDRRCRSRCCARVLLRAGCVGNCKYFRAVSGQALWWSARGSGKHEGDHREMNAELQVPVALALTLSSRGWRQV